MKEVSFVARYQAIEIRIRAERKAGKLLSGMERNQGANNQYALGDNEPKHSEFSQAKTDSNISDSQAKRWQKLYAPNTIRVVHLNKQN